MMFLYTLELHDHNLLFPTYFLTARTPDLNLSAFLFSDLTSYLSDSNICPIGDLYTHIIDGPLLCVQRFCNDNGPDTLLCIKGAVKIPP